MFHLRVIGIISPRTVSLGAFRLKASFGRTGSFANCKIPGSIPEVETVIRDSGIPIARSTCTARINAS